MSAADATELNGRYAKGQGLMRHGSSIMNMFNGDAEKSMFTMANMFDAGEEEKKRRAQDITLLMLSPYFLTRALAIFLVEVGRELWEAWQQQRKDVRPRLNRLEHWYPFVRAAMCTLMRDISTNIAILDMMRGAPSIYMLYLGYDEVAHHSGPWTADAFSDLKRMDHIFARLKRVIEEKTPRPYDLIVLSDHGQSFGATFLQRYGISVKELIEENLPEGTAVTQSIGGDTGASGLTGVAGEFANIQESGTGTAFDQVLAKQGQKLAQRGADVSDTVSNTASDSGSETGIITQAASVTAYGSGNAAQVYFDFYPRKITLSELNTTFPGMVEAVVQHEGIGMVAGYADDMAPVVIGKNGRHNLNTGEVEGDDPLLPYARESGPGTATIETRIWQMKRVMDFPNAGDLWLISSVYADGTVAALEELIGSHGGVGGEQTDAFILHPADMDVPETRNSADVFHILDNHRGRPVVEKQEESEEILADWAPGTLGRGLGDVGTWFGYALRAIFLDRSAYQHVVHDPYMTGPALLIGIVIHALASIIRTNRFHLFQISGHIALWFLAIFVLYIAGRLLTGKGTFTKTFRGMGFAQSVHIIALLALFPPLSALANLLVLVLGFMSTWMAVATAHETRGWRTIVLPLVAYLVLIVGYLTLAVMLAGAEFTLDGVMTTLGISTSH